MSIVHEQSNETQEEWRQVVGWDAYDVSDLGRLRRVRPSKGTHVGRIGKVRTDSLGYVVFELRQDGRGREFKVHRLVAEAFIGPRPDGLEVNHKDGNKENNRPSNLEYVTRSQNCKHSWDNLPRKTFFYRGEEHPSAKLTEVQAREALSLKGVESSSAVARRFGVGASTIQEIWKGTRWKHLQNSA